jgi:5-methylcytosine-specific restriction endonuclease McrA
MRQDWRRKKFKDQEGRCFYCGIAMMLEGAHKRQQNRCTLDHKTPLGRGGLDHWENVVACCDRCNRRKGYMTDAEFVRKQPVD